METRYIRYLDVVPMRDVAFKLRMRAGHPLYRRGLDVTCKDLLQYGWILPPVSDPSALHLKRVFRQHGLAAPDAKVEAVSFNVFSHTLRRSDLIGMLPDLSRSSYGEGLVSLDLEWLNETRTVAAHMVRDRPLIPGAHLFVQLIADVAHGAC